MKYRFTVKVAKIEIGHVSRQNTFALLLEPDVILIPYNYFSF